jgi:hypothetical protein
VIEHNLEVIKTADWIVDLGPEGGDAAGEIDAVGAPDDIVRDHMGQFLAPVLARGSRCGARGGRITAPSTVAIFQKLCILPI